MSSELFKAIMENVGSGYGTDYLGLAVRLDGTVAYVEGHASEQRIIDEYVSKVANTPGVTEVQDEAVVRAE